MAVAAPAPETVLAALLASAAHSARPATLTSPPATAFALPDSPSEPDVHLLRRVLASPDASPLPFLPTRIPLGLSTTEAPPWTYPVLHEGALAERSALVWKEASRNFPPKVAFHGSPGERWWSIVMSGGLKVKNREDGEEQNGKQYGEGVYLATDLGVASNFADLADARWTGAGNLQSFSCVGVCLYLDHDTLVGKASNRPKGSMPNGYIVVEDPTLVRITHIMVFPRGTTSSLKSSWRLHPLLCLLLAYLFFLLMMSVRRFPAFPLPRKLQTMLGYT